ncbi:MAG: SGNH/GDSL hydrolase family protein [Methylacidiphilales bacterium]|nr:SGNH/GDSL hydrolase family protein [Candidatus Methylacidiphilales bacterium]
MKSILILFGATLLLVLTPLRADLVLQPSDMVAICGDSITEQKMYSVFMEDYFLMCQPVEGLRSAQFGWSGEKAGAFLARIDSDVLPFKPTVVTTCYGMNDGGYMAMTQATGDAYRQAMTASVKKLKADGVRAVIVGSPGCVDGAAFLNPKVTAEEYNKTLDALRGIAQEIAQKEGVGFADVFTPMMEVNAKAKAAYGDKYQFVAGGGIHPGNNGHIVMAYAFLKALGCDGAIGTITVDLGAGTAVGTPGQKIVSCQNGTVEIESTRYPFCFQGDPDKPDQNDACVLKFFPFNDDLNRYLLVVKGLNGSKAKVTWGSVTKEFSAADLAKGINLAAEFLVNPFCDQFNKVTAAVQAQQAQETLLVKFFLHYMPAFKSMAPNSTAGLDQVAADGTAREKNLFATAAALVIPVDHTIKIESEP